METSREIKHPTEYCHPANTTSSLRKDEKPSDQKDCAGDCGDREFRCERDRSWLCGNCRYTGAKESLAPQFTQSEEWVKEYMAQFGTEPSFF